MDLLGQKNSEMRAVNGVEGVDGRDNVDMNSTPGNHALAFLYLLVYHFE